MGMRLSLLLWTALHSTFAVVISSQKKAKRKIFFSVQKICISLNFVYVVFCLDLESVPDDDSSTWQWIHKFSWLWELIIDRRRGEQCATLSRKLSIFFCVQIQARSMENSPRCILFDKFEEKCFMELEIWSSTSDVRRMPDEKSAWEKFKYLQSMWQRFAAFANWLFLCSIISLDLLWYVCWERARSISPYEAF